MSYSIFDITGKTALITGGHRGLGKGITLGLAQAGANIAVVSRTVTDAFVDEIQAYGVRCIRYNYDIADLDFQKGLVDEVIRDFGAIDILVNNAGVQSRYPSEDFPADEWHRVLRVNCDAVFFLCQRVGRHMLERGYGKIINIASINTFQGRKYISAYSASKGAVASFSRTLANEWASRGVNVNCIMPGFYETELTKDLMSDPANRTEILSRIPAGRMGVPGDLAGAAVFLASAASDYVNGHVLCVDGGWMSA
jgi:Dehydrogenases with different specificities (related to short-chain alcohol dehydrogenases)